MPGNARSLLAGGILASIASLGVSCDTQDAAAPRGEPAAAESAAPATTRDDPRPVLVAFGDSLTAGHGLAPGESYPDFLQRELDGREMAFRVVNEGVSGDTTARAMARVDAALAHDPEWVILALGANDGLRGLPLDAMEANLAAIIARFRDAGARVILAGMMLPRNYGPEYVSAFEAVYPRLAAQQGLPLIPFLLENVAMVRELNTADGIHPNAAGNEVVARQVADAFEKIAGN